MARAAKHSEPEVVNAIDLLKHQHREVEELFAKFDDTGDRATKTRQKIVREIMTKLTAHAEIEEKLLYPEGKPVDKDLTLEAYEEHDVMKDLFAKIERTSPSDESYKAKVTVLKEVVEHHVKEEEKEFFPKLRKELGKERLEELGTEMAAQFDQLAAAPRKSANPTKRHLTRVK